LIRAPIQGPNGVERAIAERMNQFGISVLRIESIDE
jgi:hypothetical protein